MARRPLGCTWSGRPGASARRTRGRPRIVLKDGMRKQFLLASDFDQTLSFNDSGIVLSELLGTSRFVEKVAGLSRLNLVQQGGELAYLLLHDPEYRRVRREHLVEVGRRIRLKHNIDRLAELLAGGIDGYHFEFYVVSPAPGAVVQGPLQRSIPAYTGCATRLRS